MVPVASSPGLSGESSRLSFFVRFCSLRNPTKFALGVLPAQAAAVLCTGVLQREERRNPSRVTDQQEIRYAWLIVPEVRRYWPAANPSDSWCSIGRRGRGRRWVGRWRRRRRKFGRWDFFWLGQ